MPWKIFYAKFSYGVREKNNRTKNSQKAEILIESVGCG